MSRGRNNGEPKCLNQVYTWIGHVMGHLKGHFCDISKSLSLYAVGEVILVEPSETHHYHVLGNTFKPLSF